MSFNGICKDELESSDDSIVALDGSDDSEDEFEDEEEQRENYDSSFIQDEIEEEEGDEDEEEEEKRENLIVERLDSVEKKLDELEHLLIRHLDWIGHKMDDFEQNLAQLRQIMDFMKTPPPLPQGPSSGLSQAPKRKASDMASDVPIPKFPRVIGPEIETPKRPKNAFSTS